MEGSTYTALAASLWPDYRVIAPDQRGHGYSGHAAAYTREDYLGDLEALLALLDLPEVVLLGNSLGGVNAYQFAARRPERVKALIIEDIGAEVTDNISFVLPWKGEFSTREELEVKIGQRFVPYLRDSFRHSEAGWHLAFDPLDMVRSQQNLVGITRQTGLLLSAPLSCFAAAKAASPQKSTLSRWLSAAPIRICWFLTAATPSIPITRELLTPWFEVSSMVSEAPILPVSMCPPLIPHGLS